MTARASSWRRLRCRLGGHAWKTVAGPDGEYLRTCTACGRVEGPFPRVERENRPPDTTYPPGGGSPF